MLIMHEHACHGKYDTINSWPQIEQYANIVDNSSIKFCDVQHVTTLDEHKIPISIWGTLPHMTFGLQNDKER